MQIGRAKRSLRGGMRASRLTLARGADLGGWLRLSRRGLERFGWGLPPSLANLWAVLVVAAVYDALAVLGTVLSAPAGFAIVWPATAFLTGVLLLAPPRHWWIYCAAVGLVHVHVVSRFHPDLPFVVVLSEIIGKLSVAVATAAAVRAVNPMPLRLKSFNSVLGFVVLAGFAVPAVVNALVLCLNFLGGWVSDFWLAWRQWMLASVVPAITIPGLLTLGFGRSSPNDRTAPFKYSLELGAVALGALIVSLLVFGLKYQSPGYVATLRLAPLPFLLWAAIRLGVAGTSLSLLIFAGAILASAVAGRGPFAIHASSAEVVSLQVFLITVSVPLLLLAALVEERTETEEALKQSEARMRVAAASTDTGLWQYDFSTRQLWATEHCRTMFDCAQDATLTPELLLAAVVPEDRPIASAAMRAAAYAGETARRSEFRVRHPSGDIRWYLATGHTEFDENLVPARLSGVFRDVTPRKKAEAEAELLTERLLTLQDEERQRIALELHDSTAQHLLAMGLNLASLRRRVVAEPATRQLFDEIDGSLGETTKELRTFTYLLNPPHLESDGLRATLERYAEGFSQRTGLKTTLRASAGADGLPAPLQRSVLRIVQEALTNVHRHAAASRVAIDLRSIGRHTHLLIRDDGQGIDRANARQADGRVRLGVGIPGMTARVEQLGGRLLIRSGPRGTTVHAAMPVR